MFRRRYHLTLVLAIVLTGCGTHSSHSRTVAPPAATVAGATITNAELETYIHYANRFFSAAYPGMSPHNPLHCDAGRASAVCGNVRTETLARLIQQLVVLHYARQHRIRLSPADRRQISIELTTLLDPTSDTADLYDRSPKTRHFLRTVLETQRIVLKVEHAVAGSYAAHGFAYHIQKMRLSSGASAYGLASRLVKAGGPVPAGTAVRVEWEAPFRLNRPVLKAVSAARPGTTVGPFEENGRYLVIRVLGSGDHAYGRPARTLMLTRLFKGWLRDHVLAAHPRCDTRSNKAACRLAMMKPA